MKCLIFNDSINYLYICVCRKKPLRKTHNQTYLPPSSFPFPFSSFLSRSRLLQLMSVDLQLATARCIKAARRKLAQYLVVASVCSSVCLPPFLPSLLRLPASTWQAERRAHLKAINHPAFWQATRLPCAISLTCTTNRLHRSNAF